MAEVDRSLTSIFLSEEEEYDTAGDPLPAPAVLPFTLPRSSLHLNRSWFGYIAGMLSRLEYIDAWDTEDEEEAQDFVNQTQDVIDAIGQFDATYTPFEEAWFGAGRSLVGETWALTSGAYNAGSNRIEGTWISSGFKYIDLTIAVGLPLVSFGVVVNNVVTTSTTRTNNIRLWVNGVEVQSAPSNGSIILGTTYVNGATGSQIRPFWCDTIRIDCWTEDTLTSPGVNQCYLTHLAIHGIGDYPFNLP